MLKYISFLKQIMHSGFTDFIVRSSTDDYCPQDQVDAIQSAVLSFLSDVYHDIEVKMCEQ